MLKPISALRPQVEEALRILGIRNFLLGIHDTAFPCLSEENLGCGSPYSRGAAQFLQFARDLGFTGIQLGPQGITTPDNPSPYDGSLFSRNPLLLAPLWLTGPPWELCDPESLAKLVSECPPARSRVHGTFARKALDWIAAEAFRRYRRICAESRKTSQPSIRLAFEDWRRKNGDWLLRDALYEILRQGYGGRHWKDWTDSEQAHLDRQLFVPPPGSERAARQRIAALARSHRLDIESFAFTQFLLTQQHRGLRDRCGTIGLKLFGDFQIGISERDGWFAQSFLLPGYCLGAPPSRTNPAGQPWNYPLLHPDKYDLEDSTGLRRPGPAIRFFRARIAKLFAEFDGLRIDHPHGLICPWVYRAGQADPLGAVQQGARLFAAPNLADHAELARFAIVRPDQLNQQTARHADDWVVTLEPDQVRRYAQLFALIMEEARNPSHGERDVICEILSTMPYPLQRVMEEYGLGRFRVTQKANLDQPQDVYRSENARPEDWLMLGNHDTLPIWRVAEDWLAAGTARRQAEYLATRLHIPPAAQEAWVTRVAADAGALVQAKFADLFLGPATNVMVYFTDLLGMLQPYNRPGTIDEANWSQRIDPDYPHHYPQNAALNRALNIPRALAMALRARGEAIVRTHRGLIDALECSFPDSDKPV